MYMMIGSRREWGKGCLSGVTDRSFGSGTNREVYLNYCWWLGADDASFLQIRLAIQGRRERHIIEGTRYTVRTLIGWHPLYTVFSLIWRQLTSQFIRQDIRLKKKRRKITFIWLYVILAENLLNKSIVNDTIY